MNCLCAIYVAQNQRALWHKWRHLLCDMMSSIISSLSILNIWWRGGLTALFRRSCSSQLLINRVVSCTCDLSFVPTRVEMETWTKHDKDIDSPTLVPRRIRAIRVRGRRLGNSPDKLNSWGHIRNCRGRLGTRLRFFICTSSVPGRTTTSQDIKWLRSLNLLSSNEG